MFGSTVNWNPLKFFQQDTLSEDNDYMKVLLVVVTEDDISWINEIENITRFLHCTVVSGPTISWDRVQNSIRDEEVDIIHFICHSDHTGIHLNNETIEPDRIIALCKNSNCQLVFFSSCASVELGQQLVEEGIPATISYVKAVNDKRALSIATSFYQAINQGNPLKKAYDIANPGGGVFIWLSNGHYAETEIANIMHQVKLIGEDILWWLRVLFFSGVSWFLIFMYFWLGLPF